jgi:hypothetical protein
MIGSVGEALDFWSGRRGINPQVILAKFLSLQPKNQKKLHESTNKISRINQLFGYSQINTFNWLN